MLSRALPARMPLGSWQLTVGVGVPSSPPPLKVARVCGGAGSCSGSRDARCSLAATATPSRDDSLDRTCQEPELGSPPSSSPSSAGGARPMWRSGELRREQGGVGAGVEASKRQKKTRPPAGGGSPGWATTFVRDVAAQLMQCGRKARSRQGAQRRAPFGRLPPELISSMSPPRGVEGLRGEACGAAAAGDPGGCAACEGPAAPAAAASEASSNLSSSLDMQAARRDQGISPGPGQWEGKGAL
jgi:hypothetical protein